MESCFSFARNKDRFHMQITPIWIAAGQSTNIMLLPSFHKKQGRRIQFLNFAVIYLGTVLSLLSFLAVTNT